MSNYHVLIQGADQLSVQVAFHIAVPDVNNEASVSYRTALSEYLGVVREEGTGSRIPNHATNFAAEASQMAAGEIYEYIETFRFSTSGLTNLQKKAELDSRFNALATSELAKLQGKLEWWGANYNVS